MISVTNRKISLSISTTKRVMAVNREHLHPSIPFSQSIRLSEVSPSPRTASILDPHLTAQNQVQSELALPSPRQWYSQGFSCAARQTT